MSVVFEGIVYSVFIAFVGILLPLLLNFRRACVSPRGYIVAAISPLGGGCIHYKRMYQVIY